MRSSCSACRRSIPRRRSTAIASLLDAHHYTDGLGFLRVGTPTNNSAEAPSGWSSQDPMHARSFGIECRAPAVPSGSNADVLARAFGFDATVTHATSAHACGTQRSSSRSTREQMATALWPATWGYYLMNLIGLEGTGLTLEAIAWAREHFIANVRAFGPLPTLRVGRQPYGVLPVTPLGGDPAKIADARERWLATTLEDAVGSAVASARARRGARRPQRRSGTGSRGGIEERCGRVVVQAALSARAALHRSPAQIHRRRLERERLARGTGFGVARRAECARLQLASAARRRGVLGRADGSLRAAGAGGRARGRGSALAELHH